MKILLNVVYSSTLEKWQYNKKKKETEKARIQVQNRKNKKGKKKPRKNKRVNSFMYWGECSVLK